MFEVDKKFEMARESLEIRKRSLLRRNLENEPSVLLASPMATETLDNMHNILFE